MLVVFRIWRIGLLGGAVVLVAACGSLLDVDNPDIIDPGGLETAQGAVAQYAGALGDFAVAHDGGAGFAFGMLGLSGLFTDEYRFGGTPPEVRQLDLTDVTKDNSFFRDTYLEIHRARVSTERAAIALTNTVGSDDVRVGEMYALSGATYIVAGEHYCSGAPFSNTVEGEIVYGGPLSTDEMMDEALGKLETASASTAGDPRIQSLIAVLRGRAYLNQGQFSEAASAVTGVLTDFEYQLEHDAGNERTQNRMKEFIFDLDFISVSDLEGGAGLNFATANDPRVVVDNPGLSRFDGETPHFRFLKYADAGAPVVLASGVEARLIEAEAALQASDIPGWIAGLDAARAPFGMGGVTDPGTQSAREDLMMRERAFALFSTGHRLGDMRRLVRQYGRQRADVFPNGAYHKDNLTRGSQMSFVIPASEENNPAFSSSDCDANAA